MKAGYFHIALLFAFFVSTAPLEADTHIRAGDTMYPVSEVPFLCDLHKFEEHVVELEIKGREGDVEAERRGRDFRWLLEKEKRPRAELERVEALFRTEMEPIKDRIDLDDPDSMPYIAQAVEIYGNVQSAMMEIQADSDCPEFRKQVMDRASTIGERMKQLEARYVEMQKSENAKAIERSRLIKAMGKCVHIAGNWRWFNGASVNCGEGVCNASNGFSGPWTCLDPAAGRVQINWTGPNGATFQDRVIVTETSLSGTNQFGGGVSATKK